MNDLSKFPRDTAWSFTDFSDGYGDWNKLSSSDSFIQDGLCYCTTRRNASSMTSLNFSKRFNRPDGLYLLQMRFKSTVAGHFLGVQVHTSAFQIRHPGEEAFSEVAMVLPLKDQELTSIVTGCRPNAPEGRIIIDWIQVDLWE
ncbi:hypothetical protein GA830_05170 [Mesorhizobium sp. NBSH29]|uniref:hypothetical protein n=1 Tax=Mesorhizobium sp. NBSH29 TaxID=2654249 RepID=UPI0018965841|nr:hypothetical protein [Mesorhizobium sp. NBSH29]QPC86199.1 hypothetical protein GA830_05170 [Mesorhizobium sp. NBSH29]